MTGEQSRTQNEPRGRWAAFVAYLRKDWLRAVIIVLAGLLSRAPGLHGQRIWDDHYLAAENPLMKSPLLILETFRQYLFIDSYSSHYRPVQTVSYLLDYFFWNTDAYGFHLTNLVLHTAGGVLLYFLLKKLFASFWLRSASLGARARVAKRLPTVSLAAFLVALLWVVHPVHSAAVDYISGRADSLAFAFAASAWLLCFRARAAQGTAARATFSALAAACALLALCSREIACIWFVIFLSHLFFVERNVSMRVRVAALVMCLLLVGTYAGLRQLPAKRTTAAAAASGWPLPMRTILMARSLGDYTRLLVVPTNLHMERSVIDPNGYAGNSAWRNTVRSEYLSLLGLLALAGFIYGCSRRGNGQPARIFGACWFFAGYLPISNLIQLNANVAEHWLYLPSVGFLIFAAGCAIDLPLRYRRGVVAFACLASLGLALRSIDRSKDWADEETFYTQTIAAGGSSTRAAVNLAEVYSRKGDIASAERIFRRVLQLTPDYPMARNNLANLLHGDGRGKEAEELFGSSAKAAVETSKDYPGTWVAALNLARIRHSEGKTEESLEILAKARVLYPQTWEVMRLQAEMLRLSKRSDEAVSLVAQYVERNWWHYGASLALGRLYAERGDAEKAEAAWRHASRLDIHDAESLNLIAAARLRQNRFDDALGAQRRAVARQPDQPRQYRMLSDILEKMGRSDEARAVLARVSEMENLARAESQLN